MFVPKTRSWALSTMLVLCAAGAVEAATYQVTNAYNSGLGSLRQAILNANQTPGLDTITFALGAGKTISPLTPLPAITGPVDLNGTSQAGYAGAPIVELNGASVSSGVGLRVKASSTTIRGLVINRFPAAGISVEGNLNNVAIKGTYIGTNVAGTVALGNGGDGISVYAADGVTIGGSAPLDRNVISGNATNGIQIWGNDSNSHIVANNRIGTNALGTAALPNGYIGIRAYTDDSQIGLPGAGNIVSGNAADGIALEGDGNVVRSNTVGIGASGLPIANGGNGLQVNGVQNVIGGAGAANVFSGNADYGILINAGANGTEVIGNRIGTDLSGLAARGNGGLGMRVFGTETKIIGNIVSANASGGISLEAPAKQCLVADNTIGLNVAGVGKLPNGGSGVTVSYGPNIVGGLGHGNVISGNDYYGIMVRENAVHTQIIENRIGTNAAGTVAIGNGISGIRVFGPETLIDANLISGNGSGISIEDPAEGSVVTGNTIGLNLAGTAELANTGNGIAIHHGAHTIGLPGRGNVLSGNDHNGLVFSFGASGSVVRSNLIGVGADGATPVGNGHLGIRVILGFENTIGGTAAGEGNVIAHNGYYGIMVEQGWGNAILGNSFFDNSYWGIDLAPYGPDLNDDADPDFGPNRTQNHPIVLSAQTSGSNLSLDGQLRSTPLSSFRIEVFGNTECDPSGMGEGRAFLGAFDVDTGVAGVTTFSTALPGAGGHPFVSATATDLATDDTSEFSPCVAATGPNPGTIQLSQDVYIGYEWDLDGLTTVKVVRSGGTAGTVSVAYATGIGAAQAGVDYTPVAGTLTFGPGEAMKTFDVPVAYDVEPEYQEDVPIVLSDPTGGAVLGSQSQADLVIISYDPALPTTYVSDAIVVEGTGGTKNALFTITVPATAAPLTVKYYTEDGTARKGVDYVETTGQVVFQPGDGPKTVAVPVIGDAAIEETEIFFLQLYPLGASVTDGTGDGLIVDDDGPTPTPTWTPSWTPTWTPTPAATATNTPANTPLPTDTPMPTNTPTPTDTPVSGSPTPTPGGAGISGHVFYYSNAQPVGDVMMTLNGAPSAQTDVAGGYAVSSLGGGSCTTSPGKLGGAESSVTSLDAARVLQAVVGLVALTDEQKLAGDVTGNGWLSSLDAARILQYRVGLIADLPAASACGSDWTFIPVPVSISGQSMVYPQLGPGSCTMGSITYDPLNGDAANQDYLAIAFGDVTGNWQPAQPVAQPLVQVAQTARSAPATLRVLAPRMRPSGKVEIPVAVNSEQPYQSLDVELSYDPTLLRALRVRKLRTSHGAMVASNVKRDGRVIVSLAAREPLDSGTGAPIAVVFEARSRRIPRSSMRLLQAEVDGRNALADRPGN